MNAAGLVLLLSLSLLGPGPETATATPAAAQLTSFEWQAIPSPQYAGESITVVILAKDENGNSYPFNGTALLSTTLGDSYVYPSYIQFSNGVCGARVFVTIAESLGLVCSKDAVSGTSNVFAVLPGAPDRLLAVMPGEQHAPGIPAGRTGRPSDQIAGDTFSFRVYLTDEWFNQILTHDDSVYFGSDDRFGQLPAGGQLSNGTGSFAASLRTAGQRRIFTRPAAGSSLLGDTSTTLNVFAGTYTNLLLVAPGETLLPGDTTPSASGTSGKTGTPYAQFLRKPFRIAVYPCDRCWNPAVGQGDTVYLFSPFPFQINPGKVQLIDSAVFSDVRAMSPSPKENIYAGDPQSGIHSGTSWLDIRALGAALEATAPDTVRSGETSQVRIRVLDANGDPIVATLVQCSVVKGSGRMLVPALLTDTVGFASSYFVCTPSPASELDSIRVSSGEADTVIAIYVRHLSDSLFAFPNPFGSINKDRTEICYFLHEASPVRVTIYDPFGNEIWSRRFRQGEPGGQYGDNSVYWDGTNKRGKRVASGIYDVQVLSTEHTGIGFKSLYRIGVVW